MDMRIMGKIVAIGDGEIGRPKEGGGFYPIETTAIDKEIIAYLERENQDSCLFQQPVKILKDTTTL